jgi:hypothetical protein
MTSAAAKIAERNLPDFFAVLFKVGGWAAVEGFANAFGGKRIRIPRTKVGDHHPIVVAAGRAAADALIEAYGATSNLQIPRAGHSLKLLVVKDNISMSANELAERLGCTYRHASNLRKEALAGTARKRRAAGRPKAALDPRQIDLEDFLK